MKKILLFLCFLNTFIFGQTVLQPKGGGTGIGSYAVGDIIYASGTGTLSKLGIGSSGKILGISGGIPVWITSPGSLSGNGYVFQNGSTTSYTTSIPNSSLANSTISGTSLGNTLNNLINGYGILGGNYNGSSTITLKVDSTHLVDKLYLIAQLAGKQNSLGFTPENVINKTTDLSTNDNTHYPSTQAVQTAINNAIAGVNPAVAVLAATATTLSTYTYSNGVSGIGATITFATGPLIVDGYTYTTIGQRVLIKNEISGNAPYNGVYFITTVGTGTLVPTIITRALDFDQPSDINSTGAIPVINGTINSTTSWVVTSSVTTVGTDAITFSKFSINPSTIVTTTGTQTISNKDLTSSTNILFNGSTSQLLTAGATTVVIGSNLSLNSGTLSATAGSGTNLGGYLVTSYGLVGDGVTDNTTALNTLLNTTAATGSTIIFPTGTFVWNGNVTVSNKYFIFQGFGTVITTTLNGTMLTVTASNATSDNWNIKGIIFSGNNTGASQEAIRFKLNSRNFFISDCSFTGFNFSAIEIDSTIGANAGFLGGLISNCKFYSNNGRGIYCGQRGEYVTISNSEFHSNGTGIYSIAGNSIINACQLNFNTNAIDFEYGINNGHSVISSCNLNHNTSYGLKLRNQPNGMTIQGCHVYSDTLRVDSCSGAIFVGGEFDVYKYSFTGNTSVQLIGVYFPNANPNTCSITGTAANRYYTSGTPPSCMTDQAGGAWTDYSTTSTTTGWSGTPTKAISYLVVGKIMFIQFSVQGTSNSNTCSFTTPFTSGNITTAVSCYAQDVGTARPTGAIAYSNSSSATINFYTDWAFTSGFTASGTKYVQGQIAIRLP